MLLNNRYHIVSRLEEGGFGQTFLAEDMQMPSKRRCVIKQLKLSTINPEIHRLVSDRFQREAAILEKLGEKHPQIPNLYAYFNQSGKFYLVQEFIEGTTLENLVRAERSLDEATVCKLLLDVLPVLEFIHAQGIIHRDIKPENIILRETDNQPVLIDFGAVREAVNTVLKANNPTVSIVIGTPGYMPSEQAAGRPIPSSDVYGLGFTAIYLLTGAIPQELKVDPENGEIQLHQYLEGLNPEFTAILNKAIHPHPQYRYKDAAQMRVALQGLTTLVAANVSPADIAPSPAVSHQPVSRSKPIVLPAQSAPVTNVQPRQNWLFIGLAGGICGSILGAFVLLGVLMAGQTPLELSRSQSTVQRENGRAETDPAEPNPAAISSLGQNQAAVSQLETATQMPSVSSPQSAAPAIAPSPNAEPMESPALPESSRPQPFTTERPAIAQPATPQSAVSPQADAEPPGTNTAATLLTATQAALPQAGRLAGQSVGTRINIRATPSTKATSPHYGLVGDRVVVLEQTTGDDSRLWYFVEFPSGAVGWVRGDLVDLQ